MLNGIDLSFVSSCSNAADQTVEMTNNGRGTSNSFSFNMFQFTGFNHDVYLHCKVNLCAKESCSPVRPPPHQSPLS